MVILDLSGVTFFSAAGIAALAQARARCAGTAEFRVAAAAPKVLRVLTLTGDLEKFPLYLCVPRISSVAVTSGAALFAVRP